MQDRWSNKRDGQREAKQREKDYWGGVKVVRAGLSDKMLLEEELDNAEESTTAI